MTPVAVVTGGARRLGAHLCEALAARGFDIVFFHRTSTHDAETLTRRLQETGRSARALVADVGIEGQVAAAFADIAARERRVDVLINNVGNYDPRPVQALTPAVWDATIASNLSGTWYCCFHALKLMNAGANIINIGTAGLEGARANVQGTDYYVGKTGVLALTRALAAAYAERKIRVNMVSPGQLENSIDLPPPNEIGRWVPLDRAGRLEEIAEAVGYLLGAEYVTGVNLDVAGGYRL
jgi:NAD(P)-dependent dehydrogenase (short-subunit alcohol dehydrogenase family)